MIIVKKAGFGLVAVAVLLLNTGGARASDILKQDQIDIFVLAGGSTFFDSTNFPDAGRVYHSRYDLGQKFTFGAAVPYGKLLSIETAFTFGPNNLVITNTNVSPHVGVVYPMHDYIGSLSAVVHAPFSRFHFRPYLEGGVEYDQFRPSRSAINYAYYNGFASVSSDEYFNRNDKFGLSAGGGIDRQLFKRVTFRIDLRDHITGSPRFGLPTKVNGYNPVAFAAPARAHDVVYTVGFLFHLGKL